MIDLESIINEEERRINEVILAKEIKIQAEAAQLVRDAGEKWLSQMPDRKRNDIEKLAIQFLLAMDSTLCFFTVSLRMIAFAPWKDSMVSIDVRQAAVVAISKGWFVKSVSFNAYPFTRAELALAAGSYLGKITPSVADDPGGYLSSDQLTLGIFAVNIRDDTYYTQLSHEKNPALDPLTFH